MYVSLLFWIGLALPGYVLVRHLWKDDLDSGFLGTIGLSYLAVFGLLSPVSILCYVSRTPLSVLSGACIVAFLVALIEVTRQAWWKDLGKLMIGGLSAGFFIVVIDMVFGAMVGGQTGGDGTLHLTRIRQLIDHGFTNNGPFVTPAAFFSVYHTNIYHALHAVCSQITGVDHVSVWFLSLVWVKLLVAAGAYYMAWAVFGRKWPAWVAAAFVVGCQGPITFIVYPNKIAPYWVVPIMIGFAVGACRSQSAWKFAIQLAVGSLVLGQLHCLYGAFIGIALAPVLGIFFLAPLVRRKSPNWSLVACIVALFAALPFLLISKQTSNASARSNVASKSVETVSDSSSALPRRTSGFRYFENGWVMMNAQYGWGIPGSVRSSVVTGCLVLGIAGTLLGRRRREVAIFLAIVVTVLVVLRVPPLCTLALRTFQREWILSRFAIFLYLGYVVLVPAAIAFLLEPKTRFWWVRSILTLAIAAAAVPFVGHRSKDYSWPGYVNKVRQPQAKRHLHLARTKTIVTFCREHIAVGSTVLVEDFQGMVLTSIHDCHVVAPQNSGNGIRDIGKRREDLKILLSPQTPWPTRRELLRKYNVKYFFPAVSARGWVRGHVKQVHQLSKRSALYVLDLDS